MKDEHEQTPQTPQAPDPLRRALGLAALGAGVLALAACGGGWGHVDDDDDDDDDDGGGGGSGDVDLRFVNGTADVLDMRLDGSTWVSGLAAFGELSDFSSAEDGETRIAARVPGASDDRVSTTLTLTRDRFLSIIVYGRESDVFLMSLLDEQQEQASSGHTLVQVMHAAAGFGNLNVYVTNVGDNLPGNPTAVVTFGSRTGFIDFSRTSHRVRVQRAGETALLFDSGDQSSEALSFSSRSAVSFVISPSSQQNRVALTSLPERTRGRLVPNRAPG